MEIPSSISSGIKGRKLMKAYLDELSCYLKHKGYMISVILAAVISYGYAAVNTTVSIDDTRGDFYLGSGHVMLSAGRFGMTFFSKLLGDFNEYVYHSFAVDVISVVFFLWAAVNFCILFRRIARKEIGMLPCTVFSCILISYPLMNEIWEYTMANLCVCVEFFCVSVAVLLVYNQIHHKWNRMELTSSALLLMLVCAAYESLVSVYIFLVFAVLALQALYGADKEKSIKEILRQGMIYAGILAGGFILKVIVSRLILVLFHLSKTSTGQVGIIWGQVSIAEGLYDLLKSMKFIYITQAIIYMPLTEFILCMLLLSGLTVFLVIRSKNPGLLLPFGGMLVSPFLLCFLQGTYTPYRACQVFSVFTAFTLLLVLTVLGQGRKKAMRLAFYAAGGGCLLLSLHQAVYLNYFLTLNHLRWEEEQRVICSISDELGRNYNMDKPVVFTGCYHLSDGIMEAASISKDSIRWKIYAREFADFYGVDYNEVYEYYGRKIPSTNVQSVLEWASYADRAYQELFRYCGFYCGEPDADMRQEAAEYVEKNEMPGYPREGYILDMGDYIIVNF